MDKEDIITICILLTVACVSAYSFIDCYETIGILLYYLLCGATAVLAVYAYRALYIAYIIVRTFNIKRLLYRYVISRQINVLYEVDYCSENLENNVRGYSINMLIGNPNSIPDILLKKSSVIELNILEKMLNTIFKMFHLEYIASNFVYNVTFTCKLRPEEEYLFWDRFYESGFYLLHDYSEYTFLSHYLFMKQKNDFPVIVINKGIRKLFSARKRFCFTSVNHMKKE